MKNRVTLLLGLCFLPLSGCRVDLSPVESAFTAPTGTWLTTWTAENPSKDQLSFMQIKALTDWFAAHQAGWKFKVTSNPAGKMILVKHTNGDFTSINLLGKALWIGNHYKLLTDGEYADFMAILGGLPANRPIEFGSHGFK